MSHYLTPLGVALATLLLAPALLTVTADQPVEEVLLIPTLLGGVPDVARLTPYDPRSPAAAALAPDAADGIYSGTLKATGGFVRLVLTPEGGIGLADIGGSLRWVTLQDGLLVPVPFTSGHIDDVLHEVDVELEAPETTSSAAAMSAQGDGVLQILVDGDYEYYKVFKDDWDDYQLRVFALVSAIYERDLDIRIEVHEQHVWKTPTNPLTGRIECTGDSSDMLVQLRNHWESVSPTTSAPRELTHAFSLKPAARHPYGGYLWGCGYLSVVESSYGYSAGRIITAFAGVIGGYGSLLQINVILTAHEVGHNFGGLHERAMPTPYGSKDPFSCVVPPSVMYPYVDCGNVPHFSRSHGQDEAWLQQNGWMREGGNAPHMKAHAAPRI